MNGMERNWEGRFDAALERLARGKAVTDETVVTDLFGRWAEALALAGKGEYEQSLANLHSVIDQSDRLGEQLVRARAFNSVAWILAEIQDHEEALEWNRRSEEAALALGLPDPEIESNARLNMGDSLTMLGRLDEAENYYLMVEPVVRDPKPPEHFALWLYSQHFFHSYGSLWLQRGDPERALSLADECIDLAQSTNRAKNVVKGRRLRGQSLLALDKVEEADKELEVALALAREVGNPPQLWKTHYALGELRRAQGRRAESLAAFQDAATVVDEVASKITNDDRKRTFLWSPHVQNIRRMAAGEKS
jgi:tetratricopeptide (TPR) repeat protein